MIEDKTTDPNAEATYIAALALLDDLPSHHDRALVALNWVKYVLLLEADKSSTTNGRSALSAFRLLCIDFGIRVAELPAVLLEDLHVEPCGKCARCRAEGLGSDKVAN